MFKAKRKTRRRRQIEVFILGKRSFHFKLELGRVGGYYANIYRRRFEEPDLNQIIFDQQRTEREEKRRILSIYFQF